MYIIRLSNNFIILYIQIQMLILNSITISNSEVHPVPTARRPLIRLSVAFFPFVAFRLNPPPGSGPSTTFGFSKT